MECREIRSVVAVTSAPELATAEAIRVPKGSASKAPFVVGAVGCIINTMAGIWFSLTTLVPILGYDLDGIIAYFLLLIGLILASIGYFGMRRNYGSGVGSAGFAVGMVVSVLFILWTIWEILGYWFGIDVWRALSETIGYVDYWQLGSYILSTIYDIFFVLLIVWGVAHVTTRRLTGNSGLSVAAGIMLILSAVFMQIWNTVWIINIAFWGYILYAWFLDSLMLLWTSLFFIGEILATILFFVAEVPRLPAKPAI